LILILLLIVIFSELTPLWNCRKAISARKKYSSFRACRHRPGDQLSYSQINILASARYEREFGAANRTEGNMAVLTLTKWF